MPLTLRDRQLRVLFADFERRFAASSAFKIGQVDGIALLAEVADTFEGFSAEQKKALSAPGLSVSQMAAIVSAGMTPSERADLTAIAAGPIPFSDPIKRVIKAVLEGSATQATGKLTITADQRAGLVGTARPGDVIEAINLTTAPPNRLHTDSTTAIATADGSGAFRSTADKLAMREGDVIRLRARHQDGSTSDWVTLKAKGRETADTRNALVGEFRIGLTAKANGVVSVQNINIGRQISEPGAVLQFRNVRTGQKTKVTLDAEGTFPPNFTVPGKAADTFAVAVSDGVNNTALTSELRDSRGQIVTLVVPDTSTGGSDLIADPTLHKDELNPDGSPRFSKRQFTGPVLQGRPTADQVVQGQLGDCYCPAGSASCADKQPDRVAEAFDDHDDGTVTVTLRKYDERTKKLKAIPIKIDRDLYVRSNGTPLYGAGSRDYSRRQPGNMVLWFPLFEKAYAMYKGGSYDKIGNGGYSSEVMALLVGGIPRYRDVEGSNRDSVFAQIKKAIDNNWPVCGGTHGEDREALYTNEGIYADHDYSILGYEERGGQKLIKMRNPWGESEPPGNGPNDGYFTITLDKFMKLYGTLSWAEVV